MPIAEVRLDHAFAEAIELEPEFRAWLLTRTRFARFAESARLLVEEQRAARKDAKHWWKHWWCRLPDGTECETDILLVFSDENVRFALHCENKPPHGKLSMRQATDYRRRAAFMSNEERWLDYSDFETVLIAPTEFILHNDQAAKQFDSQLPYEEIAQFAPLFAASLIERGPP